MHLKSLTLRGFKSFASATTLELEPGITCIVGPNGSGKSNVVDALAWVMGEQGAKSLRGQKMEDVIFAGTAGRQGRPPLGRAEVALTIDNSDGALPIDYTEVMISRTMFRNGGSEYAINGRSCRLLDVQELLSDSGIGREMHVIVGQGQLDSVLHATPEERRGFIEEAAGVLKHRRRKEKALRKLEATDGNLTRLGDLLTEIRRQLKPLARQADAARHASVVQGEVRDAKAWLLADDLLTARGALARDLADETALRRRRDEVEAALAEARGREEELESSVGDGLRSVATSQDTYVALVRLRERLRGTAALAAERVRVAEAAPEPPEGRDPQELLARARALREEEAQLAEAAAGAEGSVQAAVVARQQAEEEHAAEQRRVAVLHRAAADRREGLARLSGQVEAKRSRIAAAEEEQVRLEAARAEALSRQARAERDYTALETQVAGLAAGEEGLDAEHEGAASTLRDIEERLAKHGEEVQSADRRRAALAARREALLLGFNRKDAVGALLSAGDQLRGILGSVAGLVSVRAGYEGAVAAALGAAADAVVVEDLTAAMAAVGHLRSTHLGRAGLVPTGAPLPVGERPVLPPGSVWALDLVECPEALLGALRRMLADVAVVPDLEMALLLVEESPASTAVTRDGDLVSWGYVTGGSASAPTLLEVQAAVDAAAEELAEVTAARERLAFDQQRLERERQEAQQRVDVALARLHESDAALAAVAEALAQHGSSARGARAEAERLVRAAETAAEARARDLAALADLEERLSAACSQGEDEPDLDGLEQLASAARAARASETEARLALRTAEERGRALAGRADALQRAAEQERDARARAQAHRARVRREGEVAKVVAEAAARLGERLESSVTAAAAERDAVVAARSVSEEELAAVRTASRSLQDAHAEVLADLHRDELARSAQRMRIDQLEQRARDELGLDPEGLVADHAPGPDVPVDRAEQEQRLRTAERALVELGKVNPLALEEYAALEERHRFLTEQVEDLRRTRHDLLGIVREVDQRVEQVFSEAWRDVSAAFDAVFSRVFPGGEGRLVLTDPSNLLTTGIEVEARPPGKKVNRLSLLSGGERSLVAVAFLVALFKARPSPFYILDEVEAALDETNLGRLLELYSELRDSSQLLVITHQKRTMEIADALYGVTMRGDGVSTVISQRLREPV